MPPHSLTIFQLQKCYENEPRFNGVYTRNSLPKRKDWTYVVNLDEYKSVETYWIALHVNGDNRSASYDANCTFIGLELNIS